MCCGHVLLSFDPERLYGGMRRNVAGSVGAPSETESCDEVYQGSRGGGNEAGGDTCVAAEGDTAGCSSTSSTSALGRASRSCCSRSAICRSCLRTRRRVVIRLRSPRMLDRRTPTRAETRMTTY